MKDLQKQPWHERAWHNFQRSNWITAIWNWFLMFAGKAAEAVLTASVIYSCARLLPALHTPLWLDNTVFIWQMIALDVGGLSLRKMANQARKDGNDEGAQFASRVSTALISIMVANVTLSVVQGVTPISAQMVGAVEGILLIARAVMAVLYAHVIHSLRSDADEIEKQASVDAQDQAKQMLDAFATQMDERFTAITEMIQPVSYDVLMTQIQSHIDAQVDARVSASTLPQDASPDVQESPASDASPDASKRASRPASPRKKNASGNITPMRQSSASRDTIHKLLGKDISLSSYELARQAKCSEATARRIKNRYLETRQDASPDAQETAI